MADPMKGRYTSKNAFRDEFEKAKARLAPLGGVVSAGVHDYEAFIYEGEGLRLVFYPHKTTAGNQHIRVRTTGKFDQQKLRQAIYALAENTCTFQFPADPQLHQQAVFAAIKRDYANQNGTEQANLTGEHSP